MRAFKINFAALALLSVASAKCYYLPCNAQVNSLRQQTQQNLQESFNDVKNSLKIVKSAYEADLKALEIVNNELNIQLTLTKQNLAQSKEILFLLKKFNALQSNQNAIEAQRLAE